MKTINVPKREDVSPDSQLLFDQITKKLGKLPNLYSVIGYSAGTLKGFLQFDAAMTGGVFSVKEKEAVYLVVSEFNDCAYCLAAHTLTAQGSGFSYDETIQIRKGYSEEARLNAIVHLARYITENQGQTDPQLLNDFFSYGFKEDALIELIGIISIRIFTNYVYAATGVPLDFPQAEMLK